MALQGTSLAKFWLSGLRSCKVQALQDFGWVGYSLARCKPCKMLAEWVTVVQGASLAYGRFLKSDRGGSYFTLFLRWGHKILHVDSNGVSGPCDRILAAWMPFPATNRILNFIFLQKFLPFCPFLTICFFLRTKIKLNVIKFYTMIF